MDLSAAVFTLTAMTDFPNKTDGIYEISAIERQTITLSYITYRNQAANPALRLDLRFDFGRFSDQRGGQGVHFIIFITGLLTGYKGFHPFAKRKYFMYRYIQSVFLGFSFCFAISCRIRSVSLYLRTVLELPRLFCYIT